MGFDVLLVCWSVGGASCSLPAVCSRLLTSADAAGAEEGHEQEVDSAAPTQRLASDMPRAEAAESALARLAPFVPLLLRENLAQALLACPASTAAALQHDGKQLSQGLIGNCQVAASPDVHHIIRV